MDTTNAPYVWSLRTIVTTVVFVTILGLQFIVPFVGLVGPKPARFAWQMYAVAGLTPSEYLLVLPDGSHEEVDLTTHIISGRGDVRYDDYLPAHLCQHYPEAIGLVIRSSEASLEREHQCR